MFYIFLNKIILQGRGGSGTIINIINLAIFYICYTLMREIINNIPQKYSNSVFILLYLILFKFYFN